MKKRNLLLLLLEGMLMMPACVMAQTNGGGGDTFDPDIWRCPAQNPHAYINYDETTGIAYVCFVFAVDDAEVAVYRDGVVVDSQTINVVAGTQIPVDLSAYGAGEFTIQVRRDSTLLATYSVTL